MGGRRWGIALAVALGSLAAGAATVGAVALLTDDDGDDARRAVQLALAESALSTEVNGLLREIDAAAAAGDDDRVGELLDRLAERGRRARELAALAETELTADDPARVPIELTGRGLARVADDVARARRIPETIPVAVRRGRTEVVRLRRQIDRVIVELAPRADPDDRELLERERELLTRPPADLPAGANQLAWGAIDDDLLGDAVAGAGDVNGDGVDDLAVTVPGRSSVQVLFGGSGERELDPDGPNGFAIVNVPVDETYDEEYGYLFPQLGRIAVAGAGDVDGDGTDDLIVGAPEASADAEQQGSAFVVLGSPSPATVDLDDPEADVVRIDGPGPFWNVGDAVAGVGDVDGDGTDDVAIGGREHFGSVSMTAAEGPAAAWVLFGGELAAGERIQLPREGADPGWARIEGVGSSLAAAGDFDGDGNADLIGGDAYNRMGAPGRVAVVFGGDLRERSVDTRRGGRWGLQIEIPEGRAGGAWVAGTGDRDGDGRDDVAVGTEETTVDPDDARVTLIRGGRPGGTGLEGPRALALDGVGPAVAAAGDVDGDGSDDLLTAVAEPGGESRSQIGGATVLLGDPDRGAPSDASAVLARGFEIDLLGLEATPTEYGDLVYASSLAGIGDFDDDGRDDVAVGAPGAVGDPAIASASQRGAVFVVGWLPPALGDAAGRCDEADAGDCP